VTPRPASASPKGAPEQPGADQGAKRPERPAPPPVIWPEERGLSREDTRRCRAHFGEITSCIKALEQSDPQGAAMARGFAAGFRRSHAADPPPEALAWIRRLAGREPWPW
jgi:hypothetical protein